MTPDALSAMTHDSLRLLATLGAPIFGVILGVGLTVGIVQSATQVNDPSVGFVPKIVAVMGTLALLGPWVMARLADLVVFAMNHIAAGG
jgi:flagellar biosynthesis protein FliQ